MTSLKSTIFSLCLAVCAIAGAATITAKSYESVALPPDATLEVKPGKATLPFGEPLCDGSPANILKAEVTESEGKFRIEYGVDSGRNDEDKPGCSVSHTPIHANAVTLRRGEVIERSLDGFFIRFQG